MPTETELNQYQIVSSCEGGPKPSYRMEEGKKWRQYLAAVLCKWEDDKNSDCEWSLALSLLSLTKETEIVRRVFFEWDENENILHELW